MNEKYDVALVVPPITEASGPSLAMSLFRACLAERGIRAFVDYADYRFYENLGDIETAKSMRRNYGVDQLGEYICLPCTGLTACWSREEYYRRLASDHLAWGTTDMPALIAKGHAAVKKTVEETARRVVESGARIVAVVVQFQQLNGAYSILKRVKELCPEITALVGGAHCMDLGGKAILSHWPVADYVFFGEADEIIGEVCEKILAGEKDFPLPYGVLRRGEPIPDELPHRRTQDLNKLPYPDFTDYIATADEFPMLNQCEENEFKPLTLIVEGSRGCWWGQKKPCTFCGLNGHVYAFRDKDPERFADEIAYMARTWPRPVYFICSDSIQSVRHTKELPDLLARKLTRVVIIMTEIKSNLSEEDLWRLARVGYRQLQPGIESLHDDILKLMNKGNRGLEHIALLRYAKKLQVHITWNLLCGFPGEPMSAYEEMTAFLPMILHLQPPSRLSHILFEKRSEYGAHPEKYGLRLVPSWVYRCVMPDDEDYIEGIAIEYDNLNAKPSPEPLRRLSAVFKEWKHSWESGSQERMEMEFLDGRTEIRDTRLCSVAIYRTLTGLADRIYRRANAPVARETLAKEFGEEAQEVVDELLRDKLMIEMKGRVLSLAVETRWKSRRPTPWTKLAKFGE